ncbi:uncharacterized protein LOC144752056 [Lissotriton helveticus]
MDAGLMPPDSLEGAVAISQPSMSGAAPMVLGPSGGAPCQTDLVANLAAVLPWLTKVGAWIPTLSSGVVSVEGSALETARKLVAQFEGSKPGAAVNVSGREPVKASSPAEEDKAKQQEAAPAGVQVPPPRSSRETNAFHRPAVTTWCPQLSDLVAASLEPTTRRAYEAAFGAYYKFLGMVGWEGTWHEVSAVVSFLGSMSDGGCTVACARHHMAAVSFFANMQGKQDPTKAFIVKMALRGWQRLEGPQPGVRHPMSIDTLAALIRALDEVCSSPGEVLLFRAAFTLAFYCAFRVGELVAKNKQDWHGGLQCSHVKMHGGSLLITIPRSKTDQGGKGDQIILQKAHGSVCCPITNLEAFIAQRPPGTEGPLIIHSDGSPLTKFQFSRVMSMAVTAAGLDPYRFGTESFRIGVAPEATARGLSGSEDQRIGGGSSDCSKCYVRLHML